MSGGVEFGNRVSKPPDRGKLPHDRSAGERLAAEAAGADSPARHDEQPQPPPAFAQPAPAKELSPSGDGGGGKKPPTRLRSVDAPEPPDEGPPPTTREGAEIERQRVETDTIRAGNEDIRSETAIKEEKAASEIEANEQRASWEIQRAEKRAGIEDKGLEVDIEMSRKERFFFMGVIAVGLLIVLVSPLVAALLGQPLYFSGGGVGLLITGGGLRRLSVLTSFRRKRECLLRRKASEQQGGESGEDVSYSEM